MRSIKIINKNFQDSSISITLLTTTDYIVLIVVGLSALHGWSRGFLRSLLGPFSLILGSIFSFFYFQRTHNLFLSLLLCVLGPLLLNILFALFLGGKKTTSEDQPISSNSRALGALFNVSWNAGLLILFLFCILMIPANVFGLTKIQDDIRRSVAFGEMTKVLSNPKIQEISQDKELIKKFLDLESSILQKQLPRNIRNDPK